MIDPDHAEEVHVKLLLGLCRIRELDGAGDAEARVVDEYVDAALPADHLVHGGLHRGPVGHVHAEVVRVRLGRAAAELIHPAPLCPQLGGHGLAG